MSLVSKHVQRLIVSIKKRFRTNKQIFTECYEANHWNDPQSISGTGSSLENTAAIRGQLPSLLKKYKVRSMLDLPCGDFNWMKELNYSLDEYIGGDIVDELVSLNQQRHATSSRRFVVLDGLTEEFPKVDLLFCRDLLVHFSFSDISVFLNHLRKSDVKYLLTTHFVKTEKNVKAHTGAWRPLNLTLDPFFFPEPLELIMEDANEDDGLYRNDKALALWEISSI